MQIWRLNINPDADEDTDPRQFCLENSILGFGWPIESSSQEVTWEEYKAKAKDKYGGKSWKTAINGLHDRMEEGDLCWTRDRDGSYYLGRVEGPWRFEGEAKY